MELSQEISYVHYSPTTSSDEDDDMAASCLILLAQGGCNHHQNKKHNRISGGRRFSDVAFSGVYECKTCNRTFPSFQALGGHRASHKKPKLSDHDPIPPPAAAQPPPSPPLPAVMIAGGSKGKIHECSICGVEFSSGQALGGHMRRHRPPVIATGKDDVAAAEAAAAEDDGDRRGAMFSLDLNLPAPHEEEDNSNNEKSNSKYEFSAKQRSLVFSVPTLVDCHY